MSSIGYTHTQGPWVDGLKDLVTIWSGIYIVLAYKVYILLCTSTTVVYTVYTVMAIAIVVLLHSMSL